MSTNVVLTKPVPTAKPKVWEYTDEQKAKIEELREYANTLVLPESDPYYHREVKWLADPGCIPRYMRASKWRVEEGKRRIKGTLEWRREYKPDLIPADEVKIEAETGKIILNGFDKDGRPILYLRPGRENTKESPQQIRHLVFHIERAIDLMPPGQESMACLVDYNSTTLRTSPSISNARKFLTIVQQHYVERLGRAIVVNLPMILNFFFKGISPFLDPVTRDKIRFNPDLLELFPAEQLDAALEGGKYAYEFEHESYWKQICASTGVRNDGTRYDPESGDASVLASETKDSEGTNSEPTNGAQQSGVNDDTTNGASAPGEPNTEGGDKASTGAAVHAVNGAKLEAMRQQVIGKYEQTQANLERNEAKTKEEEEEEEKDGDGADKSTTRTALIDETATTTTT